MVYLVEVADRGEDFSHRVSRVSYVGDVSQSMALDVEVVCDGVFYDEGDVLRALDDNIMSFDDLEEFMGREGVEVKFNDSEMNV